MEFVHVFEGDDGPVNVRARDLAEYRKRFPKAEEALVFDVDGERVNVRARDVGAFKQKHGGKAEPAFGVEVGGEPVFVRERDRAAFEAAHRKPAQAEAPEGGGFETPWQGFKEGFSRGARDVAVNVAKGVASVPDVVVGTADILTAPLQAGVSKLVHGEAQTGLIGAGVEMATEAIAPVLNRVGEKIDALHSEEYLADRAGVNEADGFRATAAALARNPHVMAGSVLESVTPMLMGGGVGRTVAKAAPRLAKVAGSIGEGLVAAGSMQESFRSGNESRTTTPGQSALAAGAGLATGAIGAASNKLGGLMGAADVESVAAGVATRGARAATRLGRVAQTAAGVAMEPAEEFGQEIGEGIAENLGTGRPWDEKLKNRAVQGAAAGAAMGLGANVDFRRGPVAERVAAAVEASVPPELMEDTPAAAAKRLKAMRANRPTPPPEMPPEMPQDGPAAPPPVIVEIDGKPHEVVAENPAAQTATVVSEMGELKQVPLSMVPPKPENVVGAPPPEAPELGEVVPDADGTGQRATLVSAPMFLPPATAPEMIALPEPVPPVLPDAPPLDVPEAPPAMPPATVETPPQAETPEMPPPVAAGELPGAENVTRTKKTKEPKAPAAVPAGGLKPFKGALPAEKALKTTMAKGSAIPALKMVAVKDGVAWSTDLDNSTKMKVDLPDGVYEILGGKFVKSQLTLEEAAPSIDVAGTDGTARIADGQAFLKALANARLAASKDENRLMLTGVAVTVVPDGFELVATNGMWMNLSKVKADVSSMKQGDQFIIPESLSKAMMQDAKAPALELAYDTQSGPNKDRKVLAMNNGNAQVSGRLLHSYYPNYNQVVPEEVKNSVVVDQADMLKALKELAPIAKRAEQANSKEGSIAVSLSDGKTGKELSMRVVSSNDAYAVTVTVPMKEGGPIKPGADEVSVVMPLKAENVKGDASIAFLDAGYLEGAVKAAGDQVEIGWDDAASPLLVQTAGQKARAPVSGNQVVNPKKNMAKKSKGSSKNSPAEGEARFSPAEGEGGGVETAARGAFTNQDGDAEVTVSMIVSENRDLPKEDAKILSEQFKGDRLTWVELANAKGLSSKTRTRLVATLEASDSFEYGAPEYMATSDVKLSPDIMKAFRGLRLMNRNGQRGGLTANSMANAKIVIEAIAEAAWNAVPAEDKALLDEAKFKDGVSSQAGMLLETPDLYDADAGNFLTLKKDGFGLFIELGGVMNEAGLAAVARIKDSGLTRSSEGGARFSPAEGEGGGVETAARAPEPGVSSVRRGTPQGAAGGKLNGKPRIGLRLGDVVEFAVALANGKAPRVVERIRGLGGRAAGVFKPNADGTASIDIRADQALVVGTGERAALMAETSEQVQAELGDRPGVEDAEGRANWDERAREVFKEKLDEAFAKNVQDDPEQAMKVLAHEVGHWVDWLPDNTLKRGNVFGHIAALKGFLFGKLGLTPDQQLTAAQIEALRERALEEAGGDSKKARSIFAKLKSKAEAGSEMARLPEVKAELEKLIAWYNNAESMPEYYSEPAEMFADAFSAWLNYPAEVAARAPIFNSLVEEWIAARPEAYAHYAAIQRKLETPGMAEGEQVRKLEEGFERARRDAELAARARERVGGAELSDRVLAFFHRTMDPIYRRVARLKDAARAAETLKALADQRYWGADAERITTKVGERVVKRLQAAGVSITRFNTFLAMRRIANEGVNTMVDEQRRRGRANLFNPFGFTPRSAGAWLKAHGERFPESLAAMEAAAVELVAIRREVLFPILKASGAVSEATYEMLLENWAYAKFKVNQHGELKSALERMMGVGEGGSGLKTQRGTLREIGGPLENTVLADIAMARWALTQNANWRAIQDIMATTPEDVKELRPQWVAGKPVWRDVNTPRVKTVHVTRLGVDHAFAVPTAIARALGKRGDESVVSVLAARLVQGQARMLTTLNLGFALRNPFRDYQRAARLLPGWAYLPVIGNPQLLWRVFANLPASARRARGLADPRVDEALKRRMLVAGSGSYSTDSWHGAEDDVSKAVRNSGLGMRAAANKGMEAGRRALDLLGVVTKALQLSETAVKLASMQYLDAKFPAMPEHIKQRMVQRFGGTPDVLERSMLGSSPAARMVLLFYNINKEGVVNAVEAARERPIEQAFKTAVGAMPAIATSMAAYGVFSSMLRELAGAFDDDDDDDEAQEAKHGLALWADQVADWEAMQKSVPFRDRMLYNATAFAWADKDQRKVAYVRFVDDPMNGAVRAMTLGALEASQGRVSVFDALDIGVADQTPNLSPFASLGVALLTGKDAAFGWRDIVSDPRAINSPEGRKQNLKEYAKWTYNNISGGTLGLYRIQPDRDPAAPPPGALEEKLKTAGMGTLASSFVRVSNAGVREQFRKQDAEYEGWQYDNTKLADRWIEMRESREEIPEEMQKRRREIPPARWEQMLTERRNERNLKSKPLDVQRRKETRNRPREFR